MVREKYRYIVCQIENVREPSIISEKSLYRALQSCADAVLTDWEYAAVFPKTKMAEYFPYNRLGIFKVPLIGKRAAIRALEEIREIDNFACSVRPIKTSGIIKKARKWIIENIHKK